MSLFEGIQRIHGRNPVVYQFLKFAISGTFGAAIDFSVFTLLTRGIGFHFIEANLVSVLVAMGATFLFNKFWTFRYGDNKNLHRQSAKFFIVSSFSYGINQLILYSVVTYTSLELILGSNEDFGAKIIASLVAMVTNFTGYKFWAFRNKEERRQAREARKNPSSNS